MTATSDLASLLMDGGRTTHSTFKVPIPINDLSTCPISPDSRLANQIINSAIIIIDEAPMMHRHVYEAIDRTLRDIMKSVDDTYGNILFGGKPWYWVEIFGKCCRLFRGVIDR